MKKLCFILLLLMASFHITPLMAQNMPKILDKHNSIQLKCTDCHETTNPKKSPEMRTCFNCHESYTAIKNITKKVQPNPHGSHLGELNCSLCHSTHGSNKLYCSNCHNFLNLGFK